MVHITPARAARIVLLAEAQVGIRDPGYDCATFVKAVYREAGISTDFHDFAPMDIEAFHAGAHVGHPCFLRRKLSKSPKRITHIGIIGPNGCVYHCSRRMNGGLDLVYEIYKTCFDDLFKVYDFAFV